MPQRRTHPELVQKQIEEFGRDLGKIATSPPHVDTDTGRITSVMNPNESIIWKETYLVQNQTRCSNYNPLVSGFNRGENHGWCVLSNLPTDPTGNPAIHSHDWRDARQKWLRPITPQCLAGELTTCSGYREAKYYVPHPKQFRFSNQLVHQNFVVSDRGEVSKTEIPQYFMAMYSVEVKQVRDMMVPITISAAESVGIFVSGHLSMSSDRVPNLSLRHTINLPKNEWVRLDFMYYNPVTVSGRFSFGHNLIDYIDGWRTPQPPNEVAAFYTTFTRKDPGSVGKFSYVNAQVRPTTDAQNANGVTFVEIDWRAPGRQHFGWRRLSVPVNTTNPTFLVSGVFTVPHSSDIELRSRSVNIFGDFSNWHTVSGLFSSAGNTTPGVIDGLKPVHYNLDVGIGHFEFDVRGYRHEEWAEYIVVSGHGHDPHVTNAGVYQLLSPTNPGDMAISLTGAPPFITSGMLVSVNGGYAGDTGELHLCNGIQQGSPEVIRLLEPMTQGINALSPVKFYQVAKRSNDDHFILPKHDNLPWFFNLVGRNYNGGITQFADPIGGWKTNFVTVTADEIESGGIGASRPKLRNGAFELPFHSVVQGFSEIWQNPLDWWLTTSGQVGTAFHNPFIMQGREVYGGRQAVNFIGENLANQSVHPLIFGHHNGIQQHLFGLTFNRSYTLEFMMDAAGLGSTISSGECIVYHEFWHYDHDEDVGVDWQYGSLPPSAAFISSGRTSFMKAKTGIIASDYSSFTKSITLPPAPANDRLPMLKINLFLGSGGLHYENPGLGTKAALPIFIDEVSLVESRKSEHPFDEPVTGRRFNWQSVRLNDGGMTAQGDHLNIDKNYGMVVTRRRGNTSNQGNLRSPTTLAGFSISGYMDLPRLIAHHPNAADTGTISAPLNHTNNSKLMNGGIYVVPSGRALKFEITPRRTFQAGTETEVMIAGFWPVGWIMPSGNRTYNGHWYDPGQDAIFRVNDIRYDVVGGASQLSVSRSPIYAANNDLTIKDLRLESFTAIVDPAGQLFATHWHVCDVSIYEVSLPFVASGVNAAGTNNVGHSSKPGLPFFIGNTTSTYQE